MASATNKRLVCKSQQGFLVLEECDVELKAPPGGAIVKVSFAGICHSDVHLLKATDIPDTVWPRVMGHEISGVVVSVGESGAKGDEKLPSIKGSADEVVAGDRVLVYPWGGCRQCKMCLSGSRHCKTRMDPGSQMYGFTQDGGYQEYVTIYDRSLILKVPNEVPLDVACTVPCSGVTAYNGLSYLRQSVEEAREIHGEATVLIIGAGGLGLWATSIAKATLSSDVKVCVADIDAGKLTDASQAGADVVVTLDPNDSAKESAEKICTAAGSVIHGVADYVGNASTVESGFWSLTNTGTLAVVGMHGGDMPSIPLVSLVRKTLRIQGLFVGSIAQTNDLLHLIAEGEVQAPKPTHVTLQEVPITLQRLAEGRVKGRAVVKN